MVIYRSYERAIKNYEVEASAAYDNAMKDAQERGAELTAKGFKKALRLIFNSDSSKAILKVEDKLAKATAHQRQTKSMQDRDVMDSFKADDVVDDCLAIIVEGFEYGRYWTMDEAPKGLGGRVKPSIKLSNSAEEEK
jgi:predicted site-specific integrase-resolvase